MFASIQASDLKERLEELEVNRDKDTIASVDAINIQPSIKLSTVKKVVILLARKLTTATNKTTNLCLELICFGIISILVYLNGEYYKYHGREK